ncbi:hypothetical protein MMC13_003791 [Lambiella insularis]|nr:hypothetical protein [Lambiella insularis]
MDLPDIPETPRDVQPTRQRQPLQPLPATPLNKRTESVDALTPPLSSIFIETKSAAAPTNASTPSLSSISIQTMSAPVSTDALTPPPTPAAPKIDKEAMRSDNKHYAESVCGDTNSWKASEKESAETMSPEASALPSWEETSPLIFTGSYKLQGEFGRGVWSIVHGAIATSLPTPPTTSLPHTPPSSPPRSNLPIILAIKTPVSHSAILVLTHEARILTYLSASPASASHIVPFHGLSPASSSLVLTAIPLTLEAHARNALRRARENFSTRTMFDPVIGAAEWLALARALVRGLAWLQSHGCVHGDIKPANILLSPAHQPLYCDFSSSRIALPSLPAPLPNFANDAITPAFTAPELLDSYRGGKVGGLATFASDVFALAVTLLVAAIGESPYQSIRSEMQRLAMAREGQPLAFAQGGEQGTRVKSGELASEGVKGALRKEVGGRWGVGEWAEKMEGLEG